MKANDYLGFAAALVLLLLCLCACDEKIIAPQCTKPAAAVCSNGTWDATCKCEGQRIVGYICRFDP